MTKHPDRYLNQMMAKNTVLKHDEQLKLVRLAQKGDTKARHKLILSNLRIITKEAIKFSKYADDVDDFIAEGVIGMDNAIDKFDISRPNNFLTYSMFWVRQKMLYAQRFEHNLITLPANVSSSYHRHTQKPDNIEYTPDISKEQMASAKRARSLLYLEDMTSSEGTVFDPADTRIDVENDVMNSMTIERIMERIKALIPNERNARILCERIGIGTCTHTLSEIGDVYGITKERVRQIVKKCMTLLRRDASLIELLTCNRDA